MCPTSSCWPSTTALPRQLSRLPSLQTIGVAGRSGLETVRRSSTYQARAITLPCGVLILFTRRITVRCPAWTAPSARLSPGRETAWRLRELLTDVNIWQIEAGASASERRLPVNLISSTYVDHTPQFSPDGTKIAFSSYRTGSPEIWVCRADGSGAFQLTSFRGPETDLPAWSPDGKRIVFGSRAAGSDDIYVINPRGGQLRRLTDDASDDKGPSYSRDGKWIYFSSNRGGEPQIWKMPAEGGAPVQVTEKRRYPSGRIG